MSFQDEYKITSADRLDKGVYGLPDTPGMTTAAIQERFDSLGNLAIDKFNALVEAASDVVDGSDTKFPTNKAVEDYISGEGGAIIDDTTPSLHKAYSSQKVENMFGDVASRVIDDTEPLSNKTYSSEEIEEKLSNIPSPESIIDDDTASTDTTYSSSKLESDFISVSDTEEQTATDEFTTINGGLLSSLKVALSPNQDLHGYPEPWVGGASKQLIPMTVNALKLANAWMTWNGKVATAVGLTVTLLTDDAENVICIDVDGIANVRLDFSLGWVYTDGSYVISGSTNGGLSKWGVWQRGHGSVESEMSLDGAGTFTDTRQTDNECVLTIFQGATPSHQKFYPMLCLSSAPDPTVFAPYTNICPINGHTQVDVDVSDGQTTQEQITVNLGDTYYSGTLDVVSGVFVPDTASVEYDGSNDENITTVDNGCRCMIECPSDSIVNTDVTKLCGLISNEFEERTNNDTYNGQIGFHLRANGTHQIVFALGFDSGLNTAEKWRTWLSNNPVTVVYPLATPQSIQLSPTMVKALVGENHLSAPLEGQEITESVYSPLAKWNAVIDDTTASNDTTYSSNKINAIVPKIDDTTTSASKVFSSLKTANLITELSERFDFSTTEKPLGWWTDGKVYYGKVINIMGCPKEMFGLMVDLGVEVDTFIGIFAVGNAKDDNYNGGYCMGGTIYCKVIKSEGQNTQIQPACAVMALSRASLLVLYTKVE